MYLHTGRCPGIEEMRVRRDEVQHQIQHEEEEKSKLQQEVAVLTKQLAQLNSSLARKVCPIFTTFPGIFRLWVCPFVWPAYL